MTSAFRGIKHFFHSFSLRSLTLKPPRCCRVATQLSNLIQCNQRIHCKKKNPFTRGITAIVSEQLAQNTDAVCCAVWICGECLQAQETRQRSPERNSCINNTFQHNMLLTFCPPLMKKKEYKSTNKNQEWYIEY